MRRVVVTGLGMVTPLACGTEETWAKIKSGESGVSEITDFSVSDLPCRIAARIPRGDGSGGTYNPDLCMTPQKQRRFDEFIVFALAAAGQALKDADWYPETEEDQEATGVLVGSGIGGIGGIYDSSVTLKERGARRISPFFIPGCLINMASGQISIEYGCKGPNHSVVTACASGTHAIIDAARLIAANDADVMIAGGTESPVTRLSMAGFISCRALTTSFNDRPTEASRPYDRDRDGFVMAEGAGLLVLEEMEHAVARGAKIYAEIIGYGLSGDAFHITAPAPDSSGAYRCMKAAISRAAIAPDSIDYINAHGTSTMADGIELTAVERLFGDHSANIAMSSTKSMTGHMLGAAGAVEAIFSILAIRDQIIPPTINLDNQFRETPIDLVPKIAKHRSVEVVLSNSFGFGGTNASLIIRKFP